MRSFLFCRFYLGTSAAKTNDQKSVQDRDQEGRNNEPQQHGVAYEGFLRANPTSSGPLDVARIPLGVPAIGDLLCIQNNGQHDQKGDNPRSCNGQHGVISSAISHRGDREADGQVTIPTHDQQCKRSCEHIDTRLHVVNLTHGIPEDPMLRHDRGHQHGQPDHEKKISYGEIENVHVRHSFHLGVAQNYKDDETVSDEADDAHEAIGDDHDSAERVDGRWRVDDFLARVIGEEAAIQTAAVARPLFLQSCCVDAHSDKFKCLFTFISCSFCPYSYDEFKTTVLSSFSEKRMGKLFCKNFHKEGHLSRYLSSVTFLDQVSNFGQNNEGNSKQTSIRAKKWKSVNVSFT